MGRKLWKATAIVLSGIMILSGIDLTALAEGDLDHTILSSENLENASEEEYSEVESIVENDSENEISSENSSEEDESEIEETESDTELESPSEEVTELESEINSELTSEITLEESSEIPSSEFEEDESEISVEDTSEETTEETQDEDLEEESEPELVEEISVEEELKNKFWDSDDIGHGMYERMVWAIDKNGNLEIAGSGEIAPLPPNRVFIYEDGTQFANMPWQNLEKYIKTATVDISGVTDLSYMFYGCENLTTVNLKKLDTSSVKNMDYMFYGCKKLSYLNLTYFNTTNVTSMKGLFQSCSSLRQVVLNGLNTARVTNFSYMFAQCSNLEIVVWDQISTAKVTSMAHMFEDCKKLDYLNLSQNSFPVLSDAQGMFDGCTALNSLLVPLNFKVEVLLPGETWYRCDTQEAVTKIPNVKQSIQLLKGAFYCNIEYLGLDGASNPEENPSTYLSTQTVKFKNPTKAGYKFAGWTDIETGKKISSVKGKNVTLQANWTPIKYTITYKNNSGILDSSFVKKTSYTVEDEGYLLPGEDVFTRKNYDFEGWFLDSSYQTKITEISSGSIGNKTLYAKWEPKTYTVIFHSNRSDVSDKTKYLKYDVNYDMYTTRINVFWTQNEYVEYWNTKADGTGKKIVNIRNLVSATGEPVELYAFWKKAYTVKLTLNGGKYKNMTDLLTERYFDGTTYKLSTPTKYGFKFIGWYDTETNQKVTSLKGKSANLEARWKPIEYKITYKLNSGTFGDQDVVTTYNLETAIVNLPTPERQYYHFAGWYLDSKFTRFQSDTFYTGWKKNITFYAKWVGQEYRVEYYSGANRIGSDTWEYGSKKALRYGYDSYGDGYYWSKWYTEENGVKKWYSCGAKVMNLTQVENGVVKLYNGEKKKNTHTIKYDSNGGKGSVASQKVIGSRTVLKPSTLRKPGYYQDGWIDSYGQVVAYDEQYTCFGPYKSTIVLKANWIKIP